MVHPGCKARRGGNAEGLFADRVILCEGQDDVAAVRILFDKARIDPEASSVSVLDCGGRDNLPDYITMLDALQIVLYVVSDGDASKAIETPEVAKRVQAVEEAAGGDRLFLFDEDIEHALGTTKQRPNLPHIAALVRQMNVDELPAEHEIRQLRDQLVGFGRADLRDTLSQQEEA